MASVVEGVFMSNQGYSPMGGGAYHPPPPPPKSGQRQGNGKLTTAGVLQIIQGAFTAIIGLWFFSVSQSELGGFADDLTGGSITFIAIILLIFGGALIWTAVLCIKARKGGWVTVIVFQSIFLLGSLSGLANPDGAGQAIVGAAYCGTALFCAISGGKQSER